MIRWWCCRWLPVVVAIAFMAVLTNPVRSQPQTFLLLRSCSLLNATDTRTFFSNLNETFSEIRRQLSNNNTYYATRQQPRTSDPVYTMAQCRNYMSMSDCLACFDYAASAIRACGIANGARAVLDGCFLRYENSDFYNDTTQPGNVGLCGNQTTSRTMLFETAAEGLLSNLTAATPRINGFFAASTTKVNGTNNTVYAIAQCVPTITQSGCKDCLEVAYSNIGNCIPDIVDARAVDAGCFMRYSETPFFTSNQTTNITSFLTGGGTSNEGAIIGGVVGGVGFLILLLIAILVLLSRLRARTTPRGSLYATDLQDPIAYSYNDLKKATKNFSDDYKLGEGGFGDVYKGIVKGGNIIAVKKLAVECSGSKAVFESEVRIISNVHHRNLIRLFGCCSKGPELLLVFEYMPNGSLDKYLYGEQVGTLNWKQRCDIIFGTARGLAYLHEQYHVTIIHRDIKPSNILLDSDFQPKIADFGLARLLPDDQTHISTRVAGTLGYTAPEYTIHGQLSEKADTYSFGIVILEIVSGKKCTDVQNGSVADQNLLEHAWNLYENRMYMKLVDETLDQSEYTEEVVKKIIEIALMCTQTVSERPTMSEVALLLTDRSGEQKPPTRLNFNMADVRINVDNPASIAASVASSISNATVTMTELKGR